MLKLPSRVTVLLGLLAGVLAYLNESAFGFSPEWRGYISFGLILLSGLGITPLVGPAFRAALHLSTSASAAISTALATLALVVHSIALPLDVRGVLQAVLTFAAAVGFAPANSAARASLSSIGRVYGWRRPLPGLTYPHADTGGLSVAKEVDPRAQMPPVFDQGQLGSCTANATAAAFQYDTIKDGKDCGPLSRLWIYYFERAIEGTLGQGDCGAMGHDAFTVAKNGVPAERLWRYIISRFERKPPNLPRAYTLTKAVRAVPQTETAIKQVLSNGQTIAFGFTVYESFEGSQVARTGLVPMPAAGEQVLGGHEVLAVGFLERAPNCILCRNSWGRGWGMGGYFLMPLAYLTNTDLASDLRTIVRPV